MDYVDRNDALRFAARTRQNLLQIEAAHRRNEDVHVTTQLVTSLLGLVVFTHERRFLQSIGHLPANHLGGHGSPTWTTVIGDTPNLGELLRHVRNATAHGNITFSSDSRELTEVVLSFADRPARRQPVDWCATINAADLRDFCLQLIDLLDNTIG